MRGDVYPAGSHASPGTPSKFNMRVLWDARVSRGHGRPLRCEWPPSHEFFRESPIFTTNAAQRRRRREGWDVSPVGRGGGKHSLI